jgi:diguanylate cyclase (GGDEF)-like protein
MRAGSSIAAGGLASIVAVLAIGFAQPELSDRIALGEWGQAGAEALGAGACALAAARTPGRARLVWALFAAGQVIWAITDGANGAALLAGASPGEVSLFDIGWLAFYGPMLAAATLLYLRLRPERGWQGMLDGLLVSTAVAAAAWVLVLEPIAADASGGLTGTLVAILYPVLDLTCLLALGWILVRHGTRTPVWLRWVVGAFAVQSAAGLAYVVSALHGHEPGPVPAATFMAAGLIWTMAGVARIRAGGRPWVAGAHDAPPAWSESIPFMVGTTTVAIGALRPTVELRLGAIIAALLMAVRAIDALRVRRQLLAERDRLLVIDPLTGAYNRRFLAQEADRAFARARRGEESISAIALDLDRFKGVNDRFGHGAGDELLKAVSAALTDELRLGDLLCRLGGDEFLVLCPATDTEGAADLAERMRVTIERVALRIVPDQGVSASLGVASFPGDAADPRDLIRNADAALYAAKNIGRNMVVPFADRVVAEGVGTVVERDERHTRA